MSVRPRAIWAMRPGLALAHRASDNPDASATVGASAPELGAATTELDSAVRAGALVASGIAVDVVGTPVVVGAASDSAGSSSPPIMFPMIERTTRPPTIPPAIFQPLRFGAVWGVVSASCCPGPLVWVADVHWFPSHHRRVLGAFSGSGYQPGGLTFTRRLYQEISSSTQRRLLSADVDARLDATRVLATGENAAVLGPLPVGAQDRRRVVEVLVVTVRRSAGDRGCVLVVNPPLPLRRERFLLLGTQL